jgi:hypothetical protein
MLVGSKERKGKRKKESKRMDTWRERFRKGEREENGCEIMSVERNGERLKPWVGAVAERAGERRKRGGGTRSKCWMHDRSVVALPRLRDEKGTGRGRRGRGEAEASGVGIGIG